MKSLSTISKDLEDMSYLLMELSNSLKEISALFTGETQEEKPRPFVPESEKKKRTRKVLDHVQRQQIVLLWEQSPHKTMERILELAQTYQVSKSTIQRILGEKGNIGKKAQKVS